MTKSHKWNRFGISEQPWAIIMIGIGTRLALVLLLYRKDLFYALVVDWAVLGILIKRNADKTTSAEGVTIASIVCIATITLGLIIQIVRGRAYQSPAKVV